MRYAGRPLASAVRVVLDRWVDDHDEIISATFSITTRSLLVLYRPDCRHEKILGLLHDFSLTEDIVIAPPVKTGSSPSFSGTLFRVVFREVARTLAGAFLPAPVCRLQSVCATTRRFSVLASTFLDGNFGRCLFSAVKMLVLRVAGASLPLRIALRIGFAMLSANVVGFGLTPAPVSLDTTPHRRLRYTGRRETA